MDGDPTNGRGASVRWFALAAVALTVVSVAGARSLSWLSAPGRVSYVAGGPGRAAQPRSVQASPDVDLMPTGSIPSSALVIHLR